jgi:hypothetical protein
MPTPNNNNSITYFELALLAEDVYKENSENLLAQMYCGANER